MTTPRCFLVRHGETDWSRSGRHTSSTDVELTADGEKRVRATGKALVGDDRLIVPSRLVKIYVSPRTRAQRTLELLNLGCQNPYPWRQQQHHQQQQTKTLADARTEPVLDPQAKGTDAKITVTEDVREWEYGEYEGITSREIRQRRDERGLPGPWDIWKDGCPGGESPRQISERLDRVIHEIRKNYHAPVMGEPEIANGDERDRKGDVLIVAHGHILRAFAMRWIQKPLESTAFLMEAGGVGTLSYEHHNIHEPAILLGGSFVVGDGQ